MRPIIWYMLIMIGTVCANAQTVQLGVVKEYNERAKKTPLGGVEIKIVSAGSTVSDEAGAFALSFLTLMPGDRICVRSIEKIGYEVFNKEAVEQWNLSPATPFELVMCRSDRFKAIRDNYERHASANYERQYKSDVEAVNRLKSENKILDADYRRQLREIQEAYDRQLNNLDAYVDRFARIDLSELSEEEQKIIEQVEQGRFEEAVATYEKLNLLTKYLNGVTAVKEVSGGIDRLSEVRDSMLSDQTELLSSIERQVETLLLAGGAENNRKAAGIMCTIAEADSLNSDWLLKTGRFMMEYIGDYPRAMEYFEKALAIRERALGPDHPSTANAYSSIGTLYDNMGDYKKAFEYHIKALTIREKCFGEDHPDTTTSYTNIGGMYWNIGDYVHALEYYEKALAIMKKHIVSDHRAIAISYNNIGLVYDNAGYYSKALEYFENALAIEVKILGPNHHDVAICYNNIGGVYKHIGDYPKALEYHKKALTIQEKRLGPDHPDIAISYCNVGCVYADMSDYPKSLEYLEKARAIQEKTLGPDHPDTATTCNNIGFVYMNIGDYPKALEYFEKALAILDKTLGPDHPYTAGSYHNMGKVYNSIGDYSKALECYGMALVKYEKTLGSDHPDTANVYGNIGLVYDSMGDYMNAVEYYGRAYAYYDRNGLLEQSGDLLSLIYEAYCVGARQSGDISKGYVAFMSDKMPALKIMDEGPAAQQGMAGEYILLEYEDWNVDSEESVYDKNEALKGKPKRIVTWKDGKIETHCFQDKIGCQICIKKTGPDTKQNVTDQYRQWKKEKK